MAWTFGLGRSVWLLPLDLTFRFVGIRYSWLKWLFATMPPPVLSLTGRLRAERAVWRAIRRVPAYRAYLESLRIDPDRLPPAAIHDASPSGLVPTTYLGKNVARAPGMGEIPRLGPVHPQQSLDSHPSSTDGTRGHRAFDCAGQDRASLVRQ